MRMAGENVQKGLLASVAGPKRFGHPAEFASLCAEIMRNGYLNGEVLIDHDDQGQNLVPNTDDLLLGAEEPLDLKWFYSGEMDEFVLYDRGLTQTEIKAVQRGVEDLLVDAEGMSPTRWSVLKAQYTR